MTRKKLLSQFVLLVLLSSCAKVQVSQDYDPNFHFNTVKSFNWQNSSTRAADVSVQVDNELLHKRFRAAIENNFIRRGLSLTAHPDIFISYTYSVVTKLETDPIPPGFAFGYGSYGRYGGIGIQNGSNLRQYDQGILVISIHSGNTGELVWRGVGTRLVFTHSSPEAISRSVIETVDSILQQFPPDNINLSSALIY